jgi:hypothetical protein
VLTSFAAGQAPSNPKVGQSNTSKPVVPVEDEYVCPGKGTTVPNVKIDYDAPVYSSRQSDGTPIGRLKAGQKVTVLAGVDITREPGMAVIKYVGPDLPSSLKVGDIALVYALDADENIIFWSNGVWFAEWIEAVAEKEHCGFTSGYGPGGCTVDIIKDGSSEWWVQVETNSGITGWVLASKSGDKSGRGNFSDLCHYGED